VFSEEEAIGGERGGVKGGRAGSGDEARNLGGYVGYEIGLAWACRW
jgi:hypothetical protein